MANRSNTAAATAAAATVAAPAYVAPYVGKYAAKPKAVPANVANTVYALTAYGSTVAAAGGRASKGNVTVLGLVTVAAAHVAAKGRPLTGNNIVAAMRALPAVATAYASTRAAAMYAQAGTLPCPAWCAGYVNGAATTKGGNLLAKA